MHTGKAFVNLIVNLHYRELGRCKCSEINDTDLHERILTFCAFLCNSRVENQKIFNTLLKMKFLFENCSSIFDSAIFVTVTFSEVNCVR